VHDGDGAEAIRQRLGQAHIRHDLAGMESLTVRDAPQFLKTLADRVRAFGDFQILLYHTGADPHIDDPLGGWMTDEQLAERDRIVFETASEMGLPIAWNLAGGYRRDEAGSIAPVLAVHRRTMEACVGVCG